MSCLYEHRLSANTRNRIIVSTECAERVSSRVKEYLFRLWQGSNPYSLSETHDTGNR